MHVIPAIDIQNGECVRLFQGDFGQRTTYRDHPATVACEYREWGFRFLHLVDLDGARSGTQANHDLVAAIAQQSGLSVQLGGGIRDAARIGTWLASGIDRCVIGSVAVTDPEMVGRWLRRFEPGRIVLALDVRLDANATPYLVTHGWTRTTETDLWQCVDRYHDAGVQQVLCTDVSRDGAMSGPSLSLYEAFVSRYPDIRLQASGGVRHSGDLAALRDLGAYAAITGRALLDGKISQEEVAQFQHDA